MAAVLAAAACFGVSAHAAPVTVTLDFENVLTAGSDGIYRNATVGEFYNGGPSGAANSPNGPDYDVRFLSGSIAARSVGTDQGSGEAFFRPSASGPGALVGVGALALTADALRIDFLQAITGDFSLTYSSPNGATVELVDGAGTAVGARNLQALTGYGSQFFDVWARESITLSGAATTLFIRGVSQSLLIDNISFTRDVVEPPNGAPEPSSIALAVLALGTMAAGVRRRRPG